MNASEWPDDTVVYSEALGVTTAGELRASLEVLDGEGDTELRRWLFFTFYQPTAWPWPSGPISVGGKEYPQSVFSSDQFLPLSTSSGTYKALDVNSPSALRAHAARSLKDAMQFAWPTS